MATWGVAILPRQTRKTRAVRAPVHVQFRLLRRDDSRVVPPLKICAQPNQAIRRARPRPLLWGRGVGRRPCRPHHRRR